MISAEKQVYDILSNDAGVVAIVADRIHHKNVPIKSHPPAIAYIRISTEFTNTIHGTSYAAARVGIDIHCVADTDAEAVALANTVSLTTMLKIDRRDDYDQETELHSTIITVQVWET